MTWKQAWTGGQYSLVRILAAGTLAGGLAISAFTGSEFNSLSASLALIALAVAAGFGPGGRLLAALLAMAVSFGVGDAIDPGAGQIACLWLSVHLLLPRAPYGSLAARGREDPRQGWSMPAWYPVSCWAFFVLTHWIDSAFALNDGNQVLAGAFLFLSVLALSRKTALVAWSVSLGLGLGLAWAGFGSFSATWFLHLLTFQPAWIPPREYSEVATVFYDGSCALCHGCVRFLLSEDMDPVRFRIAPLGGDAFVARVPEAERLRAPDSIIVVRGHEVLVRSAAVLAILEALGGLWWLLAAILMLFPKGFADSVYDMIASRRYRWFGRKTDSCPMMPASLRPRLDP